MMKRTIALKNLATAAGDLLTLPAWANGWNPATMPANPILLTPRLDAVLTEMADTIIPETDSPGAKALNVQRFVQKMITDCYEKDMQTAFVNGLKNANQQMSQLKKKNLQKHPGGMRC